LYLERMPGVNSQLDPIAQPIPEVLDTSACQTATEVERLAALHRYEILDTPPEAEFDRIALLAADLFGAPTALVSLLDADRQWFKARVGADSAETRRQWSFCEHLLRAGTGDVLVVPDATTDLRFAGNPYVLGGPKVRFYAGAPLLTPEGLILGTLCVLSPTPRPEGLAPAERRRLASLAALVSSTLELRKSALRGARLAREAEARRAREERLRLALEVAGGCAWEHDPASGLTRWDPAALLMLGLPEQIPFEAALSCFVHREDLDRVRNAIAAALDPSGDGTYSVEHRTPCPGEDGHDRWLRSLGQAWFQDEGSSRPRPLRLVCVTSDITQRRAAAERQRILVDELNHRVKNTLAIVQAISEQTQRTMLTPKSGEGGSFHASFQARLLALARTHDLLTAEGWQSSALSGLAGLALHPFVDAAPAEEGERVRIAGPTVRLAPETAVALAMALHELARNAAQHGALSSASGRVTVNWHVIGDGSVVELSWSEEGGPTLSGPPARQGFGLRLLERGVGRQLKAEVTTLFATTGLRVHIRLPLRPVPIGTT
jgi:two-component sensor histidine kinase